MLYAVSIFAHSITCGIIFYESRFILFDVKGGIKMLNWGIVGAVLGAILAIISGQPKDIIIMALVGGAAFIALRKWIFRTFWQ